ncbi:hypothetical protein K438DRAFT_1859507 [Mycena galopus ATCC 62051]|nr:hypothetical protein K438DRAFT_1859507 [Mycena galopus ATCC 62051]
MLTDIVSVTAKPRTTAPGFVDLSALALEQLVAFDCDDSDSDSGSDDGYVSTLLRIQRAAAPIVAPRKIAGARRVARAASAPLRVTSDMIDVDVPITKRTAKKAEGELFQSITAIPGLESASFEELRLETYRQSLVATGTARPQPAFAPAVVIPPAFAPQFFEPSEDMDADTDTDVEMVDVDGVEVQDGMTLDPRKTQDPRKPQPQPIQTFKSAPFAFRAASYPPPSHQQQWG